MNALSQQVLSQGSSLSTSVSPYVLARQLAVECRDFDAAEVEFYKSRQRDSGLAPVSQCDAILRQGLGERPHTVADAISLLVMSMAELGPLVDGCEIEDEDLDEYVVRPALAIDRATRLLAAHFAIDVESIGGDYCLLNHLENFTPAPPDAGIIAASAEFCDLQARIDNTFRRIERTPETDEADEVLRCRLELEQGPSMDIICDTQASTLAGFQARARALVAAAPEMMPAQPRGYEGHLLASLLRDLTEGAPV